MHSFGTEIDAKACNVSYRLPNSLFAVFVLSLHEDCSLARFLRIAGAEWVAEARLALIMLSHPLCQHNTVCSSPPPGNTTGTGQVTPPPDLLNVTSITSSGGVKFLGLA